MALIILFAIFIKDVEVYGLKNLKREYVLNFFEKEKECEKLDVEVLKEKILNTGLIENVDIKITGYDTVYLMVIVTEKRRFEFSINTFLTPSENYTISLSLLDRFFFKRCEKLNTWINLLNMKEYGFIWKRYRSEFSPFLSGVYRNYKFPENYNVGKIKAITGICLKNFLISFFYEEINTPASYLFEGKNKDQIYGIVFYLKNSFLNFKHESGFYPLSHRLFNSTELNAGKKFFLKIFSFSPIFFLFSHIPLPPDYEKVFFGGKRNLKAYDFGEFKGKNGFKFMLKTGYTLLKMPFGLNFYVFFESGNTFDKYEEILKKKLFNGAGCGFEFEFKEVENFEIFFCVNERKEYKFKVFFQTPDIFERILRL